MPPRSPANGNSPAHRRHSSARPASTSTAWGYAGYYTAADRQQAETAGIDFRNRYWHPSICTNGRWQPTTDADYGPDIFAAFLDDFIARHRERPFFLYYPMVLTHGPWVPTPDSYRPGMDKHQRNSANFAANVEYMDKLVGRLVAALDNADVRDNTVIMFTGDNGTGGDGKSTATEKGARVPLIINGPGLVKQRGATARLADTSDIFSTLMDFADIPIPTSHTLDGRSLAPFLRGERETTRDWVFAYQADFRILRTERWLLEENSPRHFGKLFDCANRRDGIGYQDVTNSQSPEALAARQHFESLLENLPAPLLDHDGKPNDPKTPEAKAEKKMKRRAKHG